MDEEVNCRQKFYMSHDLIFRYYRKFINDYLGDLMEKGEEYKIKHIKKYYQIFCILQNMISVIYGKTFAYNDNNLKTNEFYCYLLQIIGCIQEDIYKFIKIFKDDNFVNEGSFSDFDNNFSKYFNIHIK